MGLSKRKVLAAAWLPSSLPCSCCLFGCCVFSAVFAFTVEHHRMVLFISATAYWFALINMLFRSRGGMMVSASLSLPPACPPWQLSNLMEGEKAREKEKKTIYTETQNKNGGCLPDVSHWWTRGAVSQSLPALKWQFIRTTYAGVYLTVYLLRVAGRVTRPSLTKILGNLRTMAWC